MHRLTHHFIAAERERQVRYAAADMGVRQLLADRLRRLNEIDAIIVVLLNACRHREHIGIEDNVFRRKADFLRQHFVRAGADFDLALKRVCLAFFVEGHDYDRRAITAHDFGVGDEFLLAFLH